MENCTDLHLIDQSARGDKRAFGHLVERYQNLVCSITYSGCGDLSLSEDLAQETFIAAWGKLSNLEDPARFRSWLCTIARNLAASQRRTGERKRRSSTESIESVAEPASLSSSPSEALISKEEEGLIWQSLEGIPEKYRTPIVLFYRQDQSVDEVALALDLTADVTRQRLSRGRAMLKEKVASLTERTLSGSRPGKSFTIATLAAIPVLGKDAAAAGIVMSGATGATAVKSAATIGMWGALLGPLIGLLGGYLGARTSIRSARSPRERKFLTRLSWVTFGLTSIFAGCLVLVIFFQEALQAQSSSLYASLLVALILTHVLGITGAVFWANRHLKRIFEEERGRGALYPRMPAMVANRPPHDYKTRATLLGLPLIHVAFGSIHEGVYCRGRALGWVAIGDVAFGVILSIGGIAVGGIALGGLAFGVLAIAGLAGGVLAFGGAAFGWAAFGGAALAWHVAFGGAAIAVDYAVGGLAIAAEANSDAAQTMLTSNPLMRAAKFLMDHSTWFLILVFLPPLQVLFRSKQSKDAS